MRKNYFVILLLLLFMGTMIYPITKKQLAIVLKKSKQEKIFSYNIDIKLIPSKKAQSTVTICCHGYGDCNQIADAIYSYNATPDHLLSFNFPDYNMNEQTYNPQTSTFGSIDEILPLLYVLKLCIIDAQLSSINLYGFSAGAGAIINMLAILNRSEHDADLKKINIDCKQKKQIISAIEAGHIILECPLKSIEELMRFRGTTKEFIILAQRYKKNGMRPIDAITNLNGLSLTIFLHFQNPDDVIGNRDDQLFIDRLKASNNGTTIITMGHDSGHVSYHPALWEKYKEFRSLHMPA